MEHVVASPEQTCAVVGYPRAIRAACLNARWFSTLADAREKLEAWRRYHNEERPHGAIGNKVPVALQHPGGVSSPAP